MAISGRQADKLEKLAAELGVADKLKVGVVVGDDRRIGGDAA